MINKMSKELYCPECGTEYWGLVINAKCGYCEHTFTKSEIIFQTRLINFIENRKNNNEKN